MRGQLLSKDKPDEAKGYGDGNGNGGVQVVHLGMSGLSTSYSRFYTSSVYTDASETESATEIVQNQTCYLCYVPNGLRV